MRGTKYFSEGGVQVAENFVSGSIHAGGAWPQASVQSYGAKGVDFERLYKLYGRRVYWWCARIVGDNADAEDLTQESFLQLFRTIHKFRGESCFSTWFHRVVVNVALGRLRKKSIRTFSLDSPPELDQENPGSSGMMHIPAAPATNPIDRVNIESALTQLPSAFRTILVLHDVQGYRHIEISRILGMPIGTSKSYLHRARRRMRTLLSVGAMRPRSAGKRVHRRAKNQEHGLLQETKRSRQEM